MNLNLDNSIANFRVQLANVVTPQLDIEKFIKSVIEDSKGRITQETDCEKWGERIFYNTMPYATDNTGQYGTSLKNSDRFTDYKTACINLAENIKEYLYGDLEKLQQTIKASKDTVEIILPNVIKTRDGYSYMLKEELDIIEKAIHNEIEDILLENNMNPNIEIIKENGEGIVIDFDDSGVVMEIEDLIKQTYFDMIKERVPDKEFAIDLVMALKNDEFKKGFYDKILEDGMLQLKDDIDYGKEDIKNTWSIDLVKYIDEFKEILSNFNSSDIYILIDLIGDIFTETIIGDVYNE